MVVLHLLEQIFFASFFMFWEVFWPLSLGFLLSAVVQSVVSHRKMSVLLGGTSPKTILLASLLGAASSSCSYAAVALARSIFTKGASFTSVMVFELASTNLVIELGIILYILLGWQFMFAEILGGIVMIVLLSIIFRFTLSRQITTLAKSQAEKGIAGKMEGHAAMDMSIEKGSIWKKIFSTQGFTAISHYFFMDIAAVWRDVLLGFLIAGVLEVMVPRSFWQGFFFTDNSMISFIVGPLIGPLVAMVSFVCSVGNVPLAAILWQGGISFGGVISFIFADLIILPILHIYKKYYGWKVMVYILWTFYVTMAAAGYIVEFLFSILHIAPTDRTIALLHQGVQWNYTGILNMIFLVLTLILAVRFVKTNGVSMVKMMNSSHHH